jgi:hypothetical protein
MTEVDVKRLKREANTRLGKALEDEAKAQKEGDPVAVQEAVSRKVRAEDDLFRLEHPVEEEVVLLSPNSAHSGEDAVGTWENGRATVPRSVAERMCAEYPQYSIEEAS